MSRVKTSAVTALVISCFSLPLTAAEIHKWVDADGITHYSDEPPPTAATPVTLIDVEQRRGIDTRGDYYSIANQWARMHRERIERDRIRLEQDRVKATQAPRTEVVYVEKPAAETRYVGIYKRKWHRRHGHQRKRYRHGQPAGYGAQAPENGKASLFHFKTFQ